MSARNENGITTEKNNTVRENFEFFPRSLENVFGSPYRVDNTKRFRVDYRETIRRAAPDIPENKAAKFATRISVLLRGKCLPLKDRKKKKTRTQPVRRTRLKVSPVLPPALREFKNKNETSGDYFYAARMKNEISYRRISNANSRETAFFN